VSSEASQHSLKQTFEFGRQQWSEPKSLVQRDESFTTGCLPVAQFDSVRSRKCGFADYRSPKIEGIVSFASSVPSLFGAIGLGTLR
jgi:hypothetical protein